MARINRIPDGLQSLLGVKALGRNPQDIEEAVRSTVDLTGFYLANKTLELSFGQQIVATPAADTEYATVEVPSGQVWWLYSVAIRWGPTGATAVNTNCVPVLRLPSSPPSTAGIHPIGSARDFGATLSSAETLTMNVDMKGMVAPPGTQFSTYVNDITTNASTTFNTSVLYVPLVI